VPAGVLRGGKVAADAGAVSSRQVADGHGCPASPAGEAWPSGWRALLIRMMSWPLAVPSAAAVLTRRSVFVTGWLITAGSGVLLRLCARGAA
jgi:hypothetical protein